MNRLMTLIGPALLAVTVASCSLTLEWDPAGMPCDGDGACAQGYSCRLEQCIVQGSVGFGETCSKPDHCGQDMLCPADAGVFFCTTSCSSYYTSDECTQGHFCQPTNSEEASGVCVPGAGCEGDEDCGAGNSCVTLNSHTSVCLPGCEITWNGTGAEIYSDNCGSTLSDPRYCQALGATGEEKLVCLESAGAQGIGATCRVGTQPCRTGSICVNNFCRSFCNPELSQLACDGGICCSGVSNFMSYGYCSSSCE